MEYRDIIYYDKDARSKLISGINKLANAVKVTLGPLGKSVILGNPSGGNPTVTKDGVSVAKYVKLIDPIEDMGAQLAKQVSSKTVSAVGDGTTTSTVIAQALINSDQKISNVTEFRKGMEFAVEECIIILSNNSISCVGNKEIINNIALTSSNGDRDIADIVTKCALATKESGGIDVVMGTSNKTTYKITEGFKFSKGYANSNFINSPSTGQCILGDCIVLTISDKVENFRDIKPILSHATSVKKSLIIIAKEFDQTFIDICARNVKMNNMIVPIVAPEFGENAIYNLEDIAIYCGSTVATMSEVSGGSDTVRIGELSSVTINKQHTVLNGSTNMKEVIDRVNQLKNLSKESENDFDRKNIDNRISQLSACTATIKVGGHTESEIKERFDRYEDTVGAVIAATEGGCIPGGGSALYHTSKLIDRSKGPLVKELISEDFNKGIDNVISSICSPINQILTNADINTNIVSDDFNIGIDAKTGKEINMFEAGVIDPLNVTVSALTNAVSIASMIMTTGCVIESPIINQ